jgi:hypothetical protein
MPDVRVKNVFEVAAVAYQHPVEAFGPYGADPMFRVRGCSWCPWRSSGYLYASTGEDRIEGGAELRVPVADQEAEPASVAVEVHQKVAGRLGDPGSGGAGGDPGQVDPAMVELDHEQHIQPG